jgi:hypothetical protein
MREGIFMMKRFLMLIVPIFLILTATPSLAKTILQTQTAGPYRIELEVLPPEPFYTAKQVAADGAKSGMLILGGAEPVQPDDPSHPNHHLVVHVFQKTTGKPLQDAKVALAVQPLDSNGQPTGKVIEVPVVRMQMISTGATGGMSGMAGMGAMAMGNPATTHYGNNLTLPAGDYRVEATANGHRADFLIKPGND